MSLFDACVDGDLEQVRTIAARDGFDIEATNTNGMTVLMLACGDGQIEIARLLVEKGANLDQVDKSEQTALKLARTNDGFKNGLVELLEKAEAERSKKFAPPARSAGLNAEQMAELMAKLKAELKAEMKAEMKAMFAEQTAELKAEKAEMKAMFAEQTAELMAQLKFGNGLRPR